MHKLNIQNNDDNSSDFFKFKFNIPRNIRNRMQNRNNPVGNLCSPPENFWIIGILLELLPLALLEDRLSNKK